MSQGECKLKLGMPPRCDSENQGFSRHVMEHTALGDVWLCSNVSLSNPHLLFKLCHNKTALYGNILKSLWKMCIIFENCMYFSGGRVHSRKYLLLLLFLNIFFFYGLLQYTSISLIHWSLNSLKAISYSLISQFPLSSTAPGTQKGWNHPSCYGIPRSK